MVKAGFNVFGGLEDLLWAAQIAPVVPVSREPDHMLLLCCEPQVDRDDGEGTFFRDRRKDARRQDVDPREGLGPKAIDRVNQFRFTRNPGLSSAKLIFPIEEKVAGGGALLNGERCQRVVLAMKPDHPFEVDGAEHIHVVHEEGLVGTSKEVRSMFQTSSGVEKNLFVRNGDVHAEILMIAQILCDHIGEVVRVDNYFADPKGAKARHGKFQQGAGPNFDQRLGAIVGERPKASAQPGG